MLKSYRDATLRPFAKERCRDYYTYLIIELNLVSVQRLLMKEFDSLAILAVE